MLGELPEALQVNNKTYEINTDFRIALLIMEALNDPELNDMEKAIVIIDNLFCDEVDPEDYEEALKQASWYLDGGVEYKNSKEDKKPVIDWVQDERYIFSAVNKVAGYETRTVEFLHWWTFLGLLSEIGESMLSTIINIRQKKNKGKKLDKIEQEFYKNNKETIDIKRTLSKEELREAEESRELIRQKLGL